MNSEKNQLLLKSKMIMNFDNFNKTKINRNNHYNVD